MSDELIILGIDPGSRATGFGVIGVQGPRSRYIASGCIRAGAGEFLQRLQAIFERTRTVFEQYHPDEIAIERVFVHHNADSALKLGHARSAALCATFSRSLPIHEYAPREIKQAVAGTGGADKTQIQTMVKHLLRLDGSIQSDAADALAVAICHAHMRTVQRVTRIAAAGRSAT
jgi:crossover junction endodeoxyribonuclease RuvC